MKSPSLTIGITAYNRRSLLEALANSLAQVDGLERARVWILDDASQEFDADFLRSIFPTAEVVRADTNSGGADQAMHRLFHRFVASRSGYLLNLDADMLVSRNLVDRCLQIVADDAARAAPCLYSVFNTPAHAIAGVARGFLVKHSVGAAGTLWERGLLAQVLTAVPVSRKFDWDWSAYLTKHNIPIYVTPTSYVQHMGRTGQHSRSFGTMDHGASFDDYQGSNLTAFLDQTREGLLQLIAEQDERQLRQAEAISQLGQALHSHTQVLQQLIDAENARRAARSDSEANFVSD